MESKPVSIAEALHCLAIPDRTPDQATFRTIMWVVRRYEMSHYGQMPLSIPDSIWRGVNRRYPGELARSDNAHVLRLSKQFDAENAALAAAAATESMLLNPKP